MSYASSSMLAIIFLPRVLYLSPSVLFFPHLTNTAQHHLISAHMEIKVRTLHLLMLYTLRKYILAAYTILCIICLDILI